MWSSRKRFACVMLVELRQAELRKMFRVARIQPRLFFLSNLGPRSFTMPEYVFIRPKSAYEPGEEAWK